MYDRDFDEAVDYIYSLAGLGWKPGLERFSTLCERLGNPQEKLRTIHIGGTNGKGSTAAMVSSILKSAGYRVGTYYSPYVYDIRERVQLDGRMIGESSFARLINIIRPHAAALAETEMGHPTEFEVKTALGLLYFVEQNADFAVLEVGLGGRLDATNVVTPLVSVITNVSMDHMDRLGDTIAEIAAEKAGIIKQNGHLVTAAADPEALSVIRRTCEEQSSLLWHVHPADGSGNCFAIGPIPGSLTPALRESPVLTVLGMNSAYSGLKLGMKGEFQLINAATAVGAVEALQRKGIGIPESAIRSGLESAYLPGRLEVLRTAPTLLIDAAHNLDGARNLARALKSSFTYEKLILVMGMVTGHSVADVVGTLAPLADRFYATAPDDPRAAPASAVAEVARVHCPEVAQVEPVQEAVRQALEAASKDDLVCVTGSFYTISEVPRPPSRRTVEDVNFSVTSAV